MRRWSTTDDTRKDTTTMEIETMCYTTLDHGTIGDWLKRVSAAHPGKHAARIDTWTIYKHPAPSGELFTLYVCTVVLVSIECEEGEMHRTGI